MQHLYALIFVLVNWGAHPKYVHVCVYVCMHVCVCILCRYVCIITYVIYIHIMQWPIQGGGPAPLLGILYALAYIKP